MTKSSWTNDAIRKRLGEAGFLEHQDERKTEHDEEDNIVLTSLWVRGQDYLKLFEYEFQPPKLLSVLGIEVDPDTLGVRNENTQTGNYRNT